MYNIAIIATVTLYEATDLYKSTSVNKDLVIWSRKKSLLFFVGKNSWNFM